MNVGIQKQHSGVTWIWLILVVSIFIGFRSWYPAGQVFADDGTTRLIGADSYFHVRHAEFSAQNFPQLQRLDPGAHYPKRQRQNVSGLYNLGIAGSSYLIAPFSGTRDPVEVAAAWTPLVLGLAAFLVMLRLAWHLGGLPGIVVVSLVHLFFPGTSVDRSTLGFADQHVLESFLALCTVWGLNHIRRRPGPIKEQLSMRTHAQALLACSPFALFFYSWLGAPMYIPVVAVSVAALILVHVWDGNESSIFLPMASYFFGTALIYLFVMLVWPEALLEIRLGIRWWLLGGFLFMGFGSLGYGRLVSLASNRGWNLQWLVVATIASIIITCTVFFAWTDDGRFFWNRISSARSAAVSEQDTVTWSRYTFLFGWFGWVALLGIPTAWIRSSGNRSLMVLITVFGTAVTSIWAMTNDFDYVPPYFIALAAFIALSQMYAIGSRWIPIGRLPVNARNSVVGGVLLVVVLLSLGSTRPFYINEDKSEHGILFGDAWHAAMEWMKSEREASSVLPTDRIIDDSPYPVGSYGVMTAWDYGNFVAHAGQMPAVVSRYPSRRDARWSTSTSEAESEEYLCRGCQDDEKVKYAIVTTQMATDMFSNRARARPGSDSLQIVGQWTIDDRRVPRALFGNGYTQSMIYRLYYDVGSGLSTWRIIYDSDIERLSFYTYNERSRGISRTSAGQDYLPVDVERDLLESGLGQQGHIYYYDGRWDPEVRIFEHVKGALVRGVTEPDAVIRLQLDLRHVTSGETYQYVHKVTADSAGHFSARLPHSTLSTDQTSHFQPMGSFSVFSDEDDSFLASLDIPESAVLLGDTLTVK